MKVALFLVFLVGLTSFTAAQSNYLTDFHDSAIFWVNYLQEDVDYYREWLSEEVEYLSYYIMERAAVRLETASNPAAGAVIQDCVGSSINYTNQLMINVDIPLRELQKGVNQLHEIVLEEILDRNLMTVDFYDFSDEFYEKLYATVDYIDYVLLYNVFYYLVDIIFAYFDISDFLDNCLEAGRINN